MIQNLTYSDIKQSCLILLQFLKRDTYVHVKKISSYIINYAISYPIITSFCFAYLQTNIFFGQGKQTLGTTLFSGNILIVLMILTYKQSVELLFDLENNRFINYQISLLHPRLVMLERILFTSIFTFCMALPFFPFSKLMLWHHLDTSNTSWIKLLIILYLGSLVCASYHQLAVLILKNTTKITSLWARVNNVLLTLGGFWIPLHVIKTYSTWLGYLSQLNPMIYISEGLRQAIIGGPEFLSFTYCMSMLIGFSVLFTIFSWYIFKQRVDHI